MKKTLSFLSSILLATTLFSACQKNGTMSAGADSTSAVASNNTSMNLAKARQLFDTVFNAHKVDAMGNYCSADYTDHTPDAGEGGKGLAANQQIFTHWFASMPDIHVTIDKISADNDLVWVMFHMTGTWKNDGMGMKATGKSFNTGGMNLFRFQNGKATDRWGYYDVMAMMQQLGMKM